MVGHDVDEAAGHVDHPAGRFAGQQGSHARAGHGLGAGGLLRDVRGHLQAVPDLAVHLDDQGDGVGLDLGGVIGGPGLLVDAVRLPEPLPQLLGEERRERREHQDEGLDRLGVLLGGEALAVGADPVGVLHQAGDGGVELVGGCSSVRRLTARCSGRMSTPSPGWGANGGEAPDAVQEAGHADQVGVREVVVLVVRPHEEEVGAEGVGADAVHILVGVDDVAPVLAHLGAVLRQEAVQAQPPERLVERDEAEVVEGLGDEPRVEVMQDDVLFAAEVHVDGEPALGELAVERAVVEVGRRVPEVVPGGVEEVVRDVGLAWLGRRR